MNHKINMTINIAPKKLKMMGLIFSASLFVGGWLFLALSYFMLARDSVRYFLTQDGLNICMMIYYVMIFFCLSGTLVGKFIFRARKKTWLPLKYLYNSMPLMSVVIIVLFICIRNFQINVENKKYEDETSHFNASISDAQYTRANEGKADAILWVVAQNPSQVWRLKPLIEKGDSHAMWYAYAFSKDTTEKQKFLHEAANQGNVMALRTLNYQARGKENDQKFK